jgi:hypothetical protein
MSPKSFVRLAVTWQGQPEKFPREIMFEKKRQLNNIIALKSTVVFHENQ